VPQALALAQAPPVSPARLASRLPSLALASLAPRTREASRPVPMQSALLASRPCPCPPASTSQSCPVLQGQSSAAPTLSEVLVAALLAVPSSHSPPRKSSTKER